jgi:hypothetical protein
MEIMLNATKTENIRERTIPYLKKAGDELLGSGRVGRSYSTSGTRRVNLATNAVIGHE